MYQVEVTVKVASFSLLRLLQLLQQTCPRLCHRKHGMNQNWFIINKKIKLFFRGASSPCNGNHFLDNVSHFLIRMFMLLFCYRNSRAKKWKTFYLSGRSSNLSSLQSSSPSLPLLLQILHQTYSTLCQQSAWNDQYWFMINRRRDQDKFKKY